MGTLPPFERVERRRLRLFDGKLKFRHPVEAVERILRSVAPIAGDAALVTIETLELA